MKPALEGRVVPIRRADKPVELSDDALLAACGVGDAAALGVLFDRHHEAIYRLASRLLHTDPAEIDDLVQTTFLGAWRSANSFSGRGSVKSFLFGIAANTIRHHLRTTTRRKRALAELPEPARPRAPDEAAVRAQQVARLAIAVDELPHDLRVAYVLCDLEDMAGVEAARVLGIRAGTLWRRLHDARRALRDAIEAEPRGGSR